MKQPGGNVTGFSLFEFSLGGKCYAAELCRMAVFGTLNPLTPARLQA